MAGAIRMSGDSHNQELRVLRIHDFAKKLERLILLLIPAAIAVNAGFFFFRDIPTIVSFR